MEKPRGGVRQEVAMAEFLFLLWVELLKLAEVPVFTEVLRDLPQVSCMLHTNDGRSNNCDVTLLTLAH